MRNTVRFTTCALPLLAVAAVAPLARAGCGDTSTLQAPFVFATPIANAQNVLLRAGEAARQMASANVTVSTVSMVGMWRIQFISQGNTSHKPSIPDGALIDFGYTQWHSDGLEILNSGAHAPATQNFCMGIWARSGYFAYELSHFALSYDATTGALNGKVAIREQVTLDPSGNEFSGTFTIDVYDPNTGSHLDHLGGNIAGQRVTVDQTTP